MSDPDRIDRLANHIAELRDAVVSARMEDVQRLTRIETTVEKLDRTLLGNGSAGLVEEHHKRLKILEAHMAKAWTVQKRSTARRMFTIALVALIVALGVQLVVGTAPQYVRRVVQIERR